MQRWSCSRLRASTAPKVVTLLICPPPFPSWQWLEAGRAQSRPAGEPGSGSRRLPLAFTQVVRLELGDEALTEEAQRRDERVELVERVLACLIRVDLELELDAPAAVGDLERRERLEVPALVTIVDAVRLMAGPR